MRIPTGPELTEMVYAEVVRAALGKQVDLAVDGRRVVGTVQGVGRDETSSFYVRVAGERVQLPLIEIMRLMEVA